MKQLNAALFLREEVLALADKYRVVEIFKSISGESFHSGEVAVFVRLYGCNLRCKYGNNQCDTPYSYEGNQYKLMTANEICDEVKKLSTTDFVVLTGGEPLIHPGIEFLLYEMAVTNDFKVDIETNGSVDIRSIVAKLMTIQNSSKLSENIIFTVDYKSPSCGMNSAMISDFAEMVDTINRCGFEVNVKCVITPTAEDVAAVEALVNRLDRISTLDTSQHLFISPVYGCDTAAIVDNMCKSELLSKCRLQLQIHKYIWDPERRGV